MVLVLAAGGLFITCNQPEEKTPQTTAKEKDYRGFSSREEFGGHLVTVSGCEDCHTPKKMGAHGPEFDSAVRLSGHPANMPDFDIDRKAMAAKGLVVTSDLTAWAGPWGMSYAANLTPDDTGIGSWSEEQFFTAIRKGKYHGLENGRNLLPPMPWEVYRYMTDDELSSIFAYLKTVKPVKNLVPPPLPPAH